MVAPSPTAAFPASRKRVFIAEECSHRVFSQQITLRTKDNPLIPVRSQDFLRFGLRSKASSREFRPLSVLLLDFNPQLLDLPQSPFEIPAIFNYVIGA